jgi:hypothetical protein
VKNVLLPVCLAFATGSLIAADFTVTNSNNSGPGSLYQAITDASIAPGADRILFNIPGPGVHKIDVSQKLLPAVVESLVIDKESAIFVRVPSAAYTATIRGKDGGTGVGLVELYNVH